MSVHVITARIYTGDVFCLGKVSSGLLGGWYPKIADAEQFQDLTKAGGVFDALVTYLNHPGFGRSLFDPYVLTSLYGRARVAEFGVAVVDGESLIYNRRRALNLMPLIDPKRNCVARRPRAAA